ncbi:hypothetical protein KO493_05170 [Tamlana agarivorans]|uniref:Uncharacterized protein n=1 Tax=Pseudotamlana agarivorans TaxID=481183 RepID=A0ACC5U739_9FLAO|nr:hypothetical protein [Tamlana agarivorans]MBU2950085.1 hypothetical protein [Tamlana agarivorans]
MKKNLLLYILLFFLLVVNGFFLFDYMENSHDAKKSEAKNPLGFIVKELKFSEVQLKDFKRINKTQRREMELVDQALRRTKDALFEKISSASVRTKEIDSLTTIIGENQKTKENLVFKHLRSIQELCNEKQKQKFQSILKDALHKGKGRDGQRMPNLPQFRGREGHRPPPPPNR